ncbi:prolyl oligopeptidase family serine peptidase [Amycolatopsis sp. SID8362]|uniref:S9 family peptidase n=1 Tax=Amycolatopsis sp. SID8362 TaxID=2690346 RepID=UPI00136B7E3C|nr:prolyl oligopeptidase family serine peptidase [Amycolatopsis sp. SID8362]NBH08679.1 prolyl oligopeptidase family serine peptidase [Amycolatopsis sp. SID8362]NED45373.1 S9 family peptidase [Amycolatopsis sp. SID8362]
MTERELTAQAVVDREIPAEPSLSPDGRWVAFVTCPVGWVGGRRTSTVWLARADGTEPPRRLTPGTADDSGPRWAPDSGSLFFLSDAQLYRVGLSGGAAERVTELPGGLTDFAPLPDGTAVALIGPGAADNEPSGLDVPHQPTDPRPDRLWLLDLPTRAVRPAADLGHHHVREVAPRPDGQTLAVLTWSTAERNPGVFEPGLFLVDVTTGATEDLGAPALDAADLIWWRHENAWQLAYRGLTPPGLVGGHAIFAVPGHRNLTAAMTSCPIELAQGPHALFADGLDTTIRRLDPATETFVEVERARGSLTGLSVTDAGTFAVIASAGNEPEQVRTHRTISRTGPTGIRWGTQERLHYQAKDGTDLDGLLVLPPGKADGPFPLVTLVHGGPYDRFADRLNLSWYPSGQWLAAAGFAVFLPNPRGSMGRGHAFAAEVAGDVGGAEWGDVEAGIGLLVEREVADEGRLGIGGGSHGGFLAAWAVGQTDRFKAAVVLAGVIDWPLLAETGEHSRFEAALGGKDNSPITHAHRIRTPVLILHGEADTNVPLSQAELLHDALRDREHEFVVYPGENHSIRGRDHQIDVLHRTREWFSRWLTPARPA